ncbi:hypothetical protein IB277_20030 [Ensifer sp. ENS07]|uniref:hypothetical protein n=1 Tax=Ensifer sp. ENS07 TaxID=2769274 RepID=UPI00177E1AC7|nr:hypothetical protein [Ensifer sp. ENS07]MBD9638597.1 hypothetical protein [Ensifer sp. ENS07]
MKTVRVFCQAFGPIVREWLIGLGQLMFVFGSLFAFTFAFGYSQNEWRLIAGPSVAPLTRPHGRQTVRRVVERILGR